MIEKMITAPVSGDHEVRYNQQQDFCKQITNKKIAVYNIKIDEQSTEIKSSFEQIYPHSISMA